MKKVISSPVYSYSDLEIPTPKTFDYKNHDKV